MGGLALLLAASGVSVIALALAGGQGGSGPAGSQPTLPAGASAAPTAPAPGSVLASPSPSAVAFAGILDGAAMQAAEWSARKDQLPLAIMLDNTANAYPHSGLASADLVYEAFVEGGITRLMAVYWRNEAPEVSPVRSARTPFVTWALELGALYAHAGGASTWNEANAVGQIAEWGVRDLDAFSTAAGAAYYRSSDRNVPYNLVTGTEKLREAAASMGFSGPPTVEPWKFRAPGSATVAGTPAEGMEVDFQGSRYSWQLVQWKWDATQRDYMRFAFGGPHVDATTGKQVAFTTVIVMLVPGEVVDESGHVLLQQIGEGPATVFTGGQAITAMWKKPAREARTRFFDASGAEIAFERGPIFIEVIDRQSKVIVSESSAGLPALPPYEPPPPGAAPDEPPATAVQSPEDPASATASPSKTSLPGQPSGTPPRPRSTPPTTAPPGTQPPVQAPNPSASP